MKSPLYIKICGITNSEDAGFAVKSGADAIGFIAYPKSPRYITPEKVKEILKSFDHYNTQKVGVFVDAEFTEIIRYIDAGIDTVQLHGTESAKFAEKCAKFLEQRTESAEVWKVIKPQSEEDIKSYLEFPADKFLLDAFNKDLHGGTGLVIDKKIAKFAVDNLHTPVIIAGGISPVNCIEIRDLTQPFGLDVNSGVEKSPGIKDHKAVLMLFNKLKK